MKKVIIQAGPGPVELDIERTAIIVVDMQNGFCKRGGMLDILGKLDWEKAKIVIEVNRKVVEAARKAGVRIIYLRMTYRPDISNAGGPESPHYWKESAVVAMRQHPEFKGKFLTSGTWDNQIIDDLQPQEEDIVIDKCRFSGFRHTELDAVLRTLGIKYIAFLGVATNICVESTLRDGFFNDYFPIMVSDGCGTFGPDYLQKATEWTVSNVFGWVTTSNELTKALKYLTGSP